MILNKVYKNFIIDQLQPEDDETFFGEVESSGDSTSHKYFITSHPSNFTEAQRMCNENGGTLISESLKSKWGLKELVFAF